MNEDIFPLPLDREKCTLIYDHSIHSYVIFDVTQKKKKKQQQQRWIVEGESGVNYSCGLSHMWPKHKDILNLIWG